MNRIETLKSFRLEAIFMIEFSLRRDDGLFKKLQGDIETYREAVKAMDPNDKVKSWEVSFNVVKSLRSIVNKLKRLTNESEIANQTFIVIRACSRIEDMLVSEEDYSDNLEKVRRYIGV